jgi:ADP-ribosylglycohydrolase
MFGAIAGDVIGSVYEHRSIKTTDFPLFQKCSRFTDDTVLTVAVAYAILQKVDYAVSLRMFGRKYHDAGYGSAFFGWIFEDDGQPYNSWGNGSAMRVSPVGFAFDTLDQVLYEAKRSAEVSHNHPEGIKGAQATALAVFLARKGESKATVKNEISRRFGYDLDRTIDSIRLNYSFDVSCQGSVPEAIIAFLDSDDYEDTIRKAISLGGDSDTLACIAGGIAHAFYGQVPDEIARRTRARLSEELLEIVDVFQEAYLL